MKEIHEEIKGAIISLDSYKYKYKTMQTQDVIDMLKRLNENVKLTLTDVVKSLPQDNFCEVCNLPTDGEKCYSKRCPV